VVTEENRNRAGWGRKGLRYVEYAVWIGLLAFVAVRLWPQVAAAVGAGRPGDPAPDLVVESLEGEPISLSELRGQVVLVNFWATWCPPCRVEMPGFQSVYEDYREEGFIILGLSTDAGSGRAVREFLDEREIDYPVAQVGEAEKRAFGGVPLLPTSILVDRDGLIRYRVEGFFAPPALRAAVRRLVREGAAP
jgi:peroxiredoxin